MSGPATFNTIRLAVVAAIAGAVWTACNRVSSRFNWITVPSAKANCSSPELVAVQTPDADIFALPGFWEDFHGRVLSRRAQLSAAATGEWFCIGEVEQKCEIPDSASGYRDECDNAIRAAACSIGGNIVTFECDQDRGERCNGNRELVSRDGIHRRAVIWRTARTPTRLSLEP